MSATSPRPSVAQEDLVRKAGRALARHGLVHAYGHCSMRLDEGHFLVSPAKPPGLVADQDACSVVPIDGPLPDGVLGEVRIHREIYRRRPEIGGVVRSMPQRVMTLGTARITPQPRHGFGSYFAPRPPLWDDPQLLRDDQQAAALAEQMGPARAIVMRGNGAVTAGTSLEEAVVLTWYLEDAARVEFEARAAGIAETGVVFGEAEAAQRATWSGAILERMWAYLTAAR
ncbi:MULTISPECIES: class II aldolase/adducin family protein [unclassified Bosea (in: a-proteobacteria)]|uniref:class II aldolase/adducin family protein n=1 Tax=unclassified Bosea (in: a-proteobacteria) TaxID=2653178 RepID=UPI001F1C08B6|nr:MULTISPECIES: class II aldolase/adducin family protein [unclassified Bosea (in: a-proteobacteria)]